jgi:hypothetical protein
MSPAPAKRTFAVMLACLLAAASLAFAQAQFARAYLVAEDDYKNGDFVAAEQKFRESLNSPDVPPNRGDHVNLGSQQYGYYPEVYLALIYWQQGRYQDVLTYAARGKKDLKKNTPLYVALVSAESASKKALANPQPVEGEVRGGGGLKPPGGGGSPTVRPAYALVIGIDHYDDPVFAPLKTATADATAISQALRDRYGFETQLLKDATRHEILTALDRYRRVASDSSSVLIYYAGHGIYDAATDKAYWLPRDAENLGTANWISADDITADIRAIPARHVLVISDSCYSGGLTREANVDITNAERARYIDNLDQRKSRHLMSSGDNEPVADGGGGDHSVFADAVLRALNRIEAPDFTAHELFQDYVSVMVAGRSKQSPQYVAIRASGHEGGDFVFHRRQQP